MSPPGPVRVLFVCAANAARSQIAEALLLKKGGTRFVVASAGHEPAAEIHPGTIAALRRIGIDWRSRHPKGLDAVLGASWDLVISLCERSGEACVGLPSRPVYGYWSIPDPVLQPSADAFDATVHLLGWRIDLMLALRPELLDAAAATERLRSIGSIEAGSDPPFQTGPLT